MLARLLNGTSLDIIWVWLVVLAVGFVLLLKGADCFVDGASSIARILKVSPLVIGLTIVALGTSLPELAVSVASAIKGENELCVGNVVGSNIFNTLMVLGFSAVFMPVVVQKDLLKKDLPYNVIISVVLLVVTFDAIFAGGQPNIISRGDGIVLIILFGIYMASVVFSAVSNRAEYEEQTAGDLKQMSVAKSIVYTVLGAVAIMVGGDFTVDAASKIAIKCGMSETLVGLTIVAVGTSLPELVTSCVAAKKGECDLAVGNVLGSNIFNALLILGVSGVISPIAITDGNLLWDVLIMLAISVLTFLVCVPKRIKRWEGILMILMYAGYMAYIIIR